MAYRIKALPAARKSKASQEIKCAADMRCLASRADDRHFVVFAQNTTGGLMSSYALVRQLERRDWFPRCYRGDIYEITINAKSGARLFIQVSSTTFAEVFIEAANGDFIGEAVTRSRTGLATRLRELLVALIPKLRSATPRAVAQLLNTAGDDSALSAYAHQ